MRLPVTTLPGAADRACRSFRSEVAVGGGLLLFGNAFDLHAFASTWGKQARDDVPLKVEYPYPTAHCERLAVLGQADVAPPLVCQGSTRRTSPVPTEMLRLET
jgi:hypothetical protein